MKRTIIALFALSGVAAADTIELTPFKDSGEEVNGIWSGAGTVSATDDKYTPPYNWSGSIATYALKESITLSNTTDTLSFSYKYTQTQANNVLTVSFVGASDVLVTGKGRFDWAQGVQAVYAEHEDAEGFALASTNNAKIKVLDSTSSDNISGGAPRGSAVTISGDIAWNTEEDQFKLTFSSSSASAASLSVALGKTFDVNKIVISSSGSSTHDIGTAESPNVVDNKAYLSALSLSATTTPVAVPEPTTATLSLLALAGLVMRRRRK